MDKIFVDKEKISQTLGIPEMIVDKIVKQFLTSLPADVNKLEDMVQSQDASSIKNQAHYLKNGFLNVALDDCVKLLQTIEKNSTDQVMVNELFSKLKERVELLEV